MYPRIVTGLCLLGLVVTAGAAAQERATGVVFHDLNGNGLRDAGEPGLPGVLVSNGAEIAETDAEGRYSLPVGTETTLFVIKPRDWMTPVDPDTQLPRFYYHHKPEGGHMGRYAGVPPTGPLPESVDFPLQPREEPEAFDMICFGDTQPRNQREIDYISHDIVTELIGSDALFGVTLGDILFDNLDFFEPLNESIGNIGVPWYNVIGNHDINFDAPERWRTGATFERVYGPQYYAFQVAGVHFLVLNNIYWIMEDRRYHGEFGEPQLTFVRNYLERAPKDELIVLLMHIPLTTTDDREQIFEMLEPFPRTFSLSAHWHRHREYFLGAEYGWRQDAPHHHIVHATTSGSWWRGVPDELGIPHATMSDGTPNGYSIIRFDGADYRLRYKAARRPAEYQMNIHAPDAVASAEAAGTAVTVNIFVGNERTEAAMRFGDAKEWTPLERTSGFDPFFEALSERQRALYTRIAEESGIEDIDDDVLGRVESRYRELLGRGLPDPRETPRLWTGTLPANPAPGSHVIHVRATDMYGQVHRGRRIIRITE